MPSTRCHSERYSECIDFAFKRHSLSIRIVSFRAVGTIFEDENVHRGISFFEPLSAKTLARIDFFLFHTCQSLKDIRLRGGDPSVKLCVFE